MPDWSKLTQDTLDGKKTSTKSSGAANPNAPDWEKLTGKTLTTAQNKSSYWKSGGVTVYGDSRMTAPQSNLTAAQILGIEPMPQTPTLAPIGGSITAPQQQSAEPQAPQLTPQQQEQQAAYEKYDTAIKQRDSLLKEQDSIDEQLRNITSRANVTGKGVTFANANDEAEYKRLEQRKEEIADSLANVDTPSRTGAAIKQTAGSLGNAVLTAAQLVGQGASRGYSAEEAIRDRVAGINAADTVAEKKAAFTGNPDLENAKGEMRGMINDAGTQLQAIKDNSDKFGAFLTDAYVTGLNIAADTAVSLMTGGVGGSVSMGLRVFGQVAAESAEKGDSLETQAAKGLTAAAIEMITEAIGGAFAKVYGKLGGKKLGDATAKAVDRFIRTDSGKMFASFLKETAEEGAQEALSDYLNILADHAFGWAEEGKSIEDDLKENKEQIIYDALLGAFVGAFGAGGNAIKAGRGGNANVNTANSIESANTQSNAPTSEIDNLINAATKQAPQRAQESAQAITQQQTQPVQQTQPTSETAQFNSKGEYGDNVAYGTDRAKRLESIQRHGKTGNLANEILLRLDPAVYANIEASGLLDNPNNLTPSQLFAEISNAADVEARRILALSGMTEQEVSARLNNIKNASGGNFKLQSQDNGWTRFITTEADGKESAMPRENGIRFKVYAEFANIENMTAANVSDIMKRLTDAGFKGGLKMTTGSTYLGDKIGALANTDQLVIHGATRADQQTAYNVLRGMGDEFSYLGGGIDTPDGSFTQTLASGNYSKYAPQNSTPAQVGAENAITTGTENATAAAETVNEMQGNAENGIPSEAETNAENATTAEEYGEDENEPVYYETADRSGESEAPTVEGVLENAQNRNSPAASAEPVANENGDYTLTAKPSKTADHTLRTIAEKLGGEQKSIYYVPTSERQTLTEAVNRVNADMVGELSKLADKEMWTAADIDTALTIYGNLKADSITSKDSTAVDAWAKIIQERGTRSGQALQALQKWTRTGAAQATTLADIIKAADNLSEEQKANLTKQINDFTSSFDSIKDGDLDRVRELIKRMNDYRGTGTFKAGRYEKILNSIDDFDYLKEYAFRQIRAVVDDATSTASLAQKLKTWQTLSQLSRLTTFNRNIFGSGAFGIQDTIAQNAFGIAIDSVVSKYTGQKTVGLDKGWLDSDARKNAAKELNRAILEIAGDVNMLGDSTRYDMSTQRTNKMNGGKAARFMSRLEQGLGYSLSASDRYLRGQIEQSIRNSLAKSGLNEKDITNIAKQMADYRLFQNNGTAAQASRDVKRLLNEAVLVKDPQGDNFGLGDLLNKYPAVPANLGVKALEYSPANIIKGIKQVSEVVNDAKTGKLDAAKQNEAVMNIARGMSGAPLVAALVAFFKTGLVRNSDDEDDPDVKAQNAAEGKSGVQINWSAIGRAINHESVEWKDGDNLMSLGWLEPINAFMAIASLIATDEDDSIPNVAVNYIDGTIQGVLDLPVMQNVSSMLDTWNYSTADSSIGKLGDVALDLAGNAATGMMPAPFAQTAKTIDPYFRDTSSDSEIGQILNNIISNTPGLRQTLPVKLDNYGEPKRYADSEIQRLLNNFILPGAVNDLHQTDVSAAIEEVYNATDNASVYPDRKAPNSFSHDKVKYALTNDEKYTYHETYGQAFEENVQALISSYNWQYRWNDEEKAEAIIKAEKQAEETAKKELVNARGGKW